MSIKQNFPKWLSKHLVAALTLLVLMTLTIGVNAEQKFGSQWTGYSWMDPPPNHYYYAQSRIDGGSTRFFLLAHARIWGATPNPLKDNDQRICYYCGITTIADVDRIYLGTRVAKHSMQWTTSGGTESLYTSATGSNSTAACWDNGIPYC